jgi:hypothetical protein
MHEFPKRTPRNTPDLRKTNDEKAQDAIHILKMVASGERFGILTHEAETILEALEYQQKRLKLAAKVIHIVNRWAKRLHTTWQNDRELEQAN